MIRKKLGESDIIDAVLFILLEEGGKLDTTTLKIKVREFLEAAGDNLLPLHNRNDQKIDQTVRTLISHRDETTNVIYLGYISYLGGKLALTPEGKLYLRERLKLRFTTDLNNSIAS